MAKKQLPVYREPKLFQISEPITKISISRKKRVRGRIKYNRWRRANRVPAGNVSDVALKYWSKK